MSIRIIGCGEMGSAIAHILAKEGRKLSLFDKDKSRAEKLAEVTHAQVLASPLEKHHSEEILLLAFKPQDFHPSMEDLKRFNGKLIVSIMTGISLYQLKAAFPKNSIARMILNLAVRYGNGIVALADDPALSHLKKEIEELFSPFGSLYWFPENKLDAITALIGSGPGFVFTIIEAMIDAAIAMGLTAQKGYELIKQMLEGSLTLLNESNKLPSELKRQVSSPSGSTIAGLRTLEAKGGRSMIIETFLAAYKRTMELDQDS